MVDRLAAHRFLAVTGASGSGKSSLVFTGLIDALERGLLAAAGSDWTILTMRPGAHPLRALAEALPRHMDALEGAHRTPTDLDLGLLRATLARGPLALKEYFLQTLQFTLDRNVLIIVDQFEELFRYRRGDDRAKPGQAIAEEKLAWREEAQAFVSLLLQSARQRSAPIYIVLTLRSDFLGECTEFLGLAEAINDSQFLTPRLTREEIRRAITGPIGVYDAEIEPELVNRILNEMGADPDQLPLMQHAMMRLWEFAEGDPKSLTLALYDTRLRSLKQALCDHADGILATLTPQQQRYAEIMFRAITEGSGSRSDRRRPTALGRIAEIADADWREFIPVVEAFSATGRNFLTHTPTLSPESVIDISHESLIRQWDTLREWVQKEFAAAGEYRRLDERAVNWRAGSPLLSGADLVSAASWRAREERRPAWAKRYGEHFDHIMALIDESERQARSQRVGRLRRRWATAGSITFIIVLFVFGVLQFSNFASLQHSKFQTDVATAQDELHDGDPESARSTILGALDLNGARAPPPNVLQVLEQLRASDTELTYLPGRSVINFAVFSPDDKRLVTTTSDFDAYLWDATTGQQIAKLEGHTDRVMCAAFAPNGETLATASFDGTVRFWNAKTGLPLHDRPVLHAAPENSAVTFVAYSKDGSRLVTASSAPWNRVQVWDSATHAPILKLGDGRAAVNSATFSNDGSKIVTASSDKIARIWDSKTGTLIHSLIGHSGAVNTAFFSPTDKLIVTASNDRTARVWDAMFGKPLGVLAGHSASVNTAVFSPNGKTIATASVDKTAAIWDSETYAQIETILGHTKSVQSAFFDHDGDRVVTTSRDQSTRIFSVKSISEALVLSGHSDQVNTAAFSSDGQRIVTASNDRTLRLWTMRTDRSITEPFGDEGAPVYSAVFSPNRREIASGSGNKTTTIWDSETRRPIRVLTGFSLAVGSVAYSPNGKLIAAASYDHSSAVWDASTGKLLVPRLPSHSDWVYSIAFSPDSKRVVTASWDGTAVVSDAYSGRKLLTIKSPGWTPYIHDRFYSAAFSPDDGGAKILTSSGNHMADVWDASTGRLISSLSGHDNIVYHADFSPDGKHIVTASQDQTARIWDWDGQRAKMRNALIGHTDGLRWAAFSPDGSSIVTASADNTARLWKMPEEMTPEEEKNWARAVQFDSPCRPTDIAQGRDSRPKCGATHSDLSLVRRVMSECGALEGRLSHESRNTSAQKAGLLKAFRCYAKYANLASNENLSDKDEKSGLDYSQVWRIRRATFARQLAVLHQTKNVADAYAEIFH